MICEPRVQISGWRKPICDQVGQSPGGWSCPTVLPSQMPSRLLSPGIMRPSSVIPSHYSSAFLSNLVVHVWVLWREIAQFRHLHWQQIWPLSKHTHTDHFQRTQCKSSSVLYTFLKPRVLVLLLPFPKATSVHSLALPSAPVTSVHVVQKAPFLPFNTQVGSYQLLSNEADLSLGCDHSCPLQWPR